jgi:hypothetical protein
MSLTINKSLPLASLMRRYYRKTNTYKFNFDGLIPLHDLII